MLTALAVVDSSVPVLSRVLLAFFYNDTVLVILSISIL